MTNVEFRRRCDSAEERQVAYPRVALLTGGGDKHYALGLASALTDKNILIDFIGSDHLVSPALDNNPRINFLNLRGDQNPNAPLIHKVSRIAVYYLRLLRFAATARAPVLHVLWNNKLEYFDRTGLLLYYKLFRRRVVFTAHNVNAAERDSVDTWLNRFTLYVQYQLVDHILVHTNKMRDEIQMHFRVNANKITVIPYGINNAVPISDLSGNDARRQLGVDRTDLTMLFFGQIAPYKGLEFLLRALAELVKESSHYRLIIAGKPKWNDAYWKKMQRIISSAAIEARVIQRIEYISDDEIEVFFKAADVLILPYTHIFQSGVQFLAYSFGLPVIATDVGSLRETIVEGQTGFVCAPRDSIELAKTIQRYFRSELFCKLDEQRLVIKEYANAQFSWERVASLTHGVYCKLIARCQT
jgi:D-inositol-3-phosphate glycosyltransferase